VRRDPENLPALALIRRAVRATGFDVIRYGPTHFAHLRRRELLERQGISVVLDVGADVGKYVDEVRASGFAGRVVSFEPHADAFRRLEQAAADDATWECLPLALGSEPGEAELNIAGNWGSSSLLAMKERHVLAAPESRYEGTEPIRVVTLDSLRDSLLSPQDRVFLKADVQGFELEVLKGAAGTLDQVFGLELELSLLPLYEGAPSISDLLAHLDEAGFNLQSVESGYRDVSTGQLLQLDGLFERR
jgi:FkbM family methyltransferase